ncbi:hypothetical protein TrRE_jg11438 [Triparma retinervis]|uniref:Uncharacterized protein n=1 Tax=Triparma retinervis TaxID=2557542 RepID=A0A9W7L4A0_9STRA|nr:hypothetical protein TrRE_jg11438 [Triparma retinervis]
MRILYLLIPLPLCCAFSGQITRTGSSTHQGSGKRGLGSPISTHTSSSRSILTQLHSAPTSQGDLLIAPPSFKLGLSFLAPSLLLTSVSLFFFPVLLFSVFLLIQTARVRFVFDDTSFSLQNAKPFSSELESSGENFVVGGENRWSYDSFVNYEFFPESFPILVYFKETQTPKDKWSEGPGTLDKVGGGQLHFFPAIVDTDCLKEEFAKRGCAKK